MWTSERPDDLVVAVASGKGGTDKTSIVASFAALSNDMVLADCDVDSDSKDIQSEELITPPLHEPGVLPKWLAGLNVELIIAGGMGQRAQGLFEQNNIDVAVGAPENEPRQLVLQYLAGQLQYGQNICDH